MAISTVEVEYIVGHASYAQVLWIMQQVSDLGINPKNITIKRDSKSAINIRKNPIQHS